MYKIYTSIHTTEGMTLEVSRLVTKLSIEQDVSVVQASAGRSLGCVLRKPHTVNALHATDIHTVFC